MNKQLVIDKLGDLFETALIEEIGKDGIYRKFPEGAELMDIGQPIQFFPIVTEGSLKVLTEGADGQELLLYYLEMGDTCAMTLQCCLAGATSSIRVVAEYDSEMITIPINRMEEWIVKYASWRKFIFNSYHERLSEMLGAIDNLAFNNLEERLYRYLKDKALINGSADVKMTHQQVAREMNTSRVVISRLLKKLEIQQMILTDRNSIQILELT